MPRLRDALESQKRSSRGPTGIRTHAAYPSLDNYRLTLSLGFSSIILGPVAEDARFFGKRLRPVGATYKLIHLSAGGEGACARHRLAYVPFFFLTSSFSPGLTLKPVSSASLISLSARSGRSVTR